MEKELYLFIVWHNALHKEKDIIKDLNQKFEIIQIFEINWSKELFIKNLSRFYGKKLIKSQKKLEQIGDGKFTVITVYDNNPKHSDGKNTNILKAKRTYREMTGGGHLVHASDNVQETKENILLLLGITLKEFEDKYHLPWNNDKIIINNDLVGSKGWEDENAFENFIGKIDNCHIEKDKKINVIKTNNISKLCRLINASSLMFSFTQIHNVLINGNKKPIIIKSIII